MVGGTHVSSTAQLGTPLALLLKPRPHTSVLTMDVSWGCHGSSLFVPFSNMATLSKPPFSVFHYYLCVFLIVMFRMGGPD